MGIDLFSFKLFKTMQKIKFLVFVCFLVINVSCAQQKRYVSYKVKQGETMKDIADKLDIRTKDLMKLNPDVSKRPSANTVIIIPNPKLKDQPKTIITDDSKITESETVIESKESAIEENTFEQPIDTVKIERVKYEYETHTVLPKETVYALTKKYNVSKDELIRLNPEFPGIKDNNLSIGQVLKVKETVTKTYVSLEEDLKNYVTHKVKPKETIYGLTRFYNISKEDLIQLNPESPEIANNYIQIDQILRIRKIEDKLDTDDTAFYLDTINNNKTLKIAYLLPFKAKEYDTIATNDVFDKNPLTHMVTDFYLGADIAIDSIRQQGVPVDVSLFDTGNRGKKTTEILASDKLNDVDVIIGPFYSSKAELVANKVKVPVVFPHFSKKQHEFKSPRLIKAEPDLDTHSTFLANYLKNIYNGETIFVVGDGKENSENQIRNLVTELRKHDSIQEVHILKPEDGYIKKERFTDHMKPKSHCWMILTSDDKVAVADALNSMVVLPEEVTGQVFAIQKNKAYNEIDNNKLARIDFAYVTPHFTDEKSKTTKAFNRKFKSKNYANPTDYATKGFDISYDILMRLASGNKLKKSFNEGATLRLESKFDFENNGFKPTSNKGLFLIQYNKDLSLERLK